MTADQTPTPPAARIQEPYGQRGPEDVDFPWPRLLKPAHVCGATFGVGVSSRLVVECAQRHAKYRAEEGTKTPEQRQVDEANRRALWDMLNENHDARNPLREVLDEQRQRSVYSLAHTQQPAAAQAKSEALRRYLSDTLQGGTANEKTVARTALRLLDSVAAPQQEAERQPLTEPTLSLSEVLGLLGRIRAAIEATPIRQEPLGGQYFSYVKQGDMIDLLNLFSAPVQAKLGITGPATQETKHG